MRRIITLSLVVILMTFLTPYAYANENDVQVKFNDISTLHWANNAISELAQLNYIKGYPDGSFRPNSKITRAEFMTMFGNVLKDKYPTGNIYDHSSEKEIISVSHWAYSSVNEVFKYIPSQYLSKIYTGTYQPDEFITRDEVVIVISLALDNHNNVIHGGGTIFLPKDFIESKFSFGIEFSYHNGIITGYPDGTFKPKNNINRAEIAAIMIKVLKLIQ